MNYLASVVVGPNPHPSMPIIFILIFLNLSGFTKIRNFSFSCTKFMKKKKKICIKLKNFLVGQKAAPGSTPRKFYLQCNKVMKLFIYRDYILLFKRRN